VLEYWLRTEIFLGTTPLLHHSITQFLGSMLFSEIVKMGAGVVRRE
jgi:hypothetical protein